jgi:uncharacterized RDD family membrane protein YckC
MGSRLFARLVDSLLLAPVVLVAAVVLGDAWWASVVGLVVATVYEIALTSWRGQTAGKILFRLRVVDGVTGEGPAPVSLVLRWLVLDIGTIGAIAVPELRGVASLIGFVVIVVALRPPLHRGLHDLAAGTVVTRLADRHPEPGSGTRPIAG